MQRIKFTTTLDTDLIQYLKIKAIKENTDANQIIERLLRLDQTKGQTEMTATYFNLSADRAEEIAACSPRLTPETVTEYATADWAEGDEHQTWINTAPAQEIADWILSQLDA